MANEAAKAVDKLKVGDQVLATDPATGRTSPQPVIATTSRIGAMHLVQLTVDTGGDSGHGTGVLIATDGHPFWVPAASKWIDAGELRPGMWLRTSSGTRVRIAAVTTWTRQQRVHDLTVDTDHTYYVYAGETTVLVHNRTCSIELRQYANSLPKNSSNIHVVARLTTRLNPRGYFGHNMDRSNIGDIDYDAQQAIERQVATIWDVPRSAASVMHSRLGILWKMR